MTSLSTLPQEIIDLIIPHLTKQDFTACVRVNHAWSALFTPSLWSIVRLVDRTIFDCIDANDAHKALARNCHHIRTFETTDAPFALCLAIQYPSLSHLTSLALRLKDEPLSLTKIFPSASLEEDGDYAASYGNAVATVRLLMNNRNLRSVSLNASCFKYRFGEDGFPLVISAIHVEHLEKLEISFLDPTRNRNDGDDDDNDISRTIDTTYDAGQDFNRDFTKAIRIHNAVAEFECLIELTIIGVVGKTLDGSRLAFLARCPHLEIIRLDRLDNIAMTLVQPLLKKFCPKLRRLDWTNPGIEMDWSIAGLLRVSKAGWRVLRLPYMAFFNQTSFSALMESVETLEELKIEGWRAHWSSALSLMQGARNLCRLEGVADGERRRYAVGLVVDASEAYMQYVEDRIEKGLDRSWVLGSSMEYYQMQINNVPRPDVVCRRDGGELRFQPAELVSYRLDVHRWIYTQLARMTGLKELVLGVPDYQSTVLATYGLDESLDSVELERALSSHPTHIFNYMSLEFSLESGLERLGGLKELEVLDVKSTAHRIGVAELEWMHVNWPKLKVIKGLVTERRWAGESEAGLKVKIAVEEWLAAHPHGIGSSFIPTPSTISA
ncbi:hypothetical protein BGZ97_002050 [Linnemannia gamsii]|jgi:hypothetical protein|uniref:F-box domain-containing protein n=1 Tax=Linnemannia gamsii TaxID=64522 RepID=A0A9P6QVB1_9FUNG|nr:hypothetical protein BGZ97_002050 [Linnemannia gamsii]